MNAYATRPTLHHYDIPGQTPPKLCHAIPLPCFTLQNITLLCYTLLLLCKTRPNSAQQTLLLHNRAMPNFAIAQPRHATPRYAAPRYALPLQGITINVFSSQMSLVRNLHYATGRTLLAQHMSAIPEEYPQ